LAVSMMPLAGFIPLELFPLIMQSASIPIHYTLVTLVSISTTKGRACPLYNLLLSDRH
jgi:hypothetical protein